MPLRKFRTGNRIRLQQRSRMRLRVTQKHVFVAALSVAAITIGIVITLNLSQNTKAFATGTGTAIVDGNWNAASTWSFSGVNRVPTCGDTVNIPLGRTVTVNSQENLAGCGSAIIINVYGVFQFTNGNKLDLPCGSYVYIRTGGLVKKATAGGGSSTLITICNVDMWKAGDGPLPGIDTLYIPGGGTSLPIRLISFEARPANPTVKLEWSTASELNNNFFTVERSADGMQFETIFMVSGAGNSTSTLHYNGEDENPLEGLSYYRLKQTDFDGHYTYSDIVTVKNGNTEASEKLELMSVSPNPFDDNFKITFKAGQTGELDFQFYTPSGQLAAQDKISFTEGMNTYEFIDRKNLGKGIYFMSLVYNHQKITRQIIKN